MSAAVHAEAVRIRTELARRAGMLEPPPLEELLTSADYFGLSTASPLQRAVCRAIDGRPLAELAELPEVVAAFGGREAIKRLPIGTKPAEVVLMSGIRTAKSLTAAAVAVRSARGCDVSRLTPGETPRISVVSLQKDLAKVVFNHVDGNTSARPKMRAWRIGEPTEDTLMLRHPTGRPVEFRVVAGARSGATLVARWSAGVVFDESPRMLGQEDGVVNLDDLRSATLGRMLPGAQIFYIGSPWAPRGPVYELFREHFGKPSAAIVVIRAPAFSMNPVIWTPEACEELRKRDPQVYWTDILAQFADPETALLSSVELERCTRKGGDLPPEPGHTYVAAMDPATRRNAWTLVVTTKTREGRLRVSLARQWIGTKAEPLSPRKVLGEIADLVRPYGVRAIDSDQWAGDALADLAQEVGLSLCLVTFDERRKTNLYRSFATQVAEGVPDLPDDPYLRSDLLAVRLRVMQGGGTAVVLPKTADGRHCDYAPPTVLALSRYLDEPLPPPPVDGTTAAAQRAEAEMERDDFEAQNRRKSLLYDDD